MENTIKIRTSTAGEHLASILLIYTGGTLGMVYDKEGTLLKPFDFNQLLEKVPELHRLEVELTILSIRHPKDSSNFNMEDWLELADIIFKYRNDFDGFVVLHGTDTMAYTASALSYLLYQLNKPVILTGAQLPLGVARTDARENLITSIEIAAAGNSSGPLIREVCIYFDYYLLRGNRAKKVQSSHFDAFVSENYPVLAEAGVTIEYNNESLLHNAPGDMPSVFRNLSREIGVVKLFPGLDFDLTNCILQQSNLKALIIETFGAGNAPTDKKFIRSLSAAIERGVIVYNITQCLGGKVTQGKYETSKSLKNIGVLSGGNITFEAAITKLMFMLNNPMLTDNIKQSLQYPLCGEMDADEEGIS